MGVCGKKFLMSMVCACAAIPLASPPLRAQPSAQDQQYAERQIVHRIFAVLKSGHMSVRLDLHGTCSEMNSEFISIPNVHLADTPDFGDLLTRIQKLFRDEPAFKVAAASPRIVHVTMTGTTTDLLDIPVSIDYLTPTAQYNPHEAIYAIENKAAMKAAMNRLHAKPAIECCGQLEEIPSPRFPHLPESMGDVAVGQALDRILKVFPGLMVYKECTRLNGDRLFSIDYY